MIKEADLTLSDGRTLHFHDTGAITGSMEHRADGGSRRYGKHGGGGMFGT